MDLGIGIDQDTLTRRRSCDRYWTSGRETNHSLGHTIIHISLGQIVSVTEETRRHVIIYKIYYKVLHPLANPKVYTLNPESHKGNERRRNRHSFHQRATMGTGGGIPD